MKKKCVINNELKISQYFIVHEKSEFSIEKEWTISFPIFLGPEVIFFNKNDDGKMQMNKTVKNKKNIDHLRRSRSWSFSIIYSWLGEDW